MVKSKMGQRLVGLFLFALGAGFTAWVWHTALTEGYYYRKAAALFPAFAVLGLSAVLFPIDLEEHREVHGTDRPRTFRELPVEWKIMTAAALAAGLFNWYMLAN